MNLLDITIGIISILIGYLLGSILPAYWLGRLLNNFDIREHGSGNAGTANVYHQLGLGPAVITAFFDTLKGIIAMGIALIFGAHIFFIYLSGVLAVVGHMFPFYLKFRGAQGVATSTGLLLTFLVILIANDWLSPIVFIYLVGLTLAGYLIFRKGSVLGIVIPPALYIAILINSPAIYLNIFTGIIILHMTLTNLISVIRDRSYPLKAETREAILHVRVLMRPAAIIFPILYTFISKYSILILIGSVTLFFLFVDLSRILSKRINFFVFERLSFFFREKEKHTFSTATQFLVAIFLTILLFERSIASMAIIFVTFGDIFAKFTGFQFGKIKMFGKSLEGTLAYFASSLLLGLLWTNIMPLPANLIVLGALAASLTELVPLGVSDNFSIPLISASVMRIAQIF